MRENHKDAQDGESLTYRIASLRADMRQYERFIRGSTDLSMLVSGKSSRREPVRHIAAGRTWLGR
jgi:hypothetical protein